MPSPALLPTPDCASEQPPLTHDQEHALELLLQNRPQSEILQAVGIHKATLWRWRNLPQHAAFQDAYRQGLEELREKGQLRILRTIDKAANLLDRLADPEGQLDPEDLGAWSLKLAAAREVLDRTGLGKVQRIESTSTSRSESVSIHATADLPDDLARELAAWRERRSTSSPSASEGTEGGG